MDKKNSKRDLPFITHPLHQRKICLIQHGKKVKEKYMQTCPFCHPPTQLPTRSSNAPTKETCSNSTQAGEADGVQTKNTPGSPSAGGCLYCRQTLMNKQANHYGYFWLQLEMIKNGRKWLDKKRVHARFPHTVVSAPQVIFGCSELNFEVLMFHWCCFQCSHWHSQHLQWLGSFINLLIWVLEQLAC